LIDDAALDKVLVDKRKAIAASLSRIDIDSWGGRADHGAITEVLKSFKEEGPEGLREAKQAVLRRLLGSSGKCGDFTYDVNKVMCAILSSFTEETRFKDAGVIKTAWCTSEMDPVKGYRGILLIEPQVTTPINKKWFNADIRKLLPPLTALYEWCPKGDTVFGPAIFPSEINISWPLGDSVVTTILAVLGSRVKTVMAAKQDLAVLFEAPSSGLPEFRNFAKSLQDAKSDAAVVGLVQTYEIANANATSFKWQLNNFIGDVFAKFATDGKTTFKQSNFFAFQFCKLDNKPYAIGEPSSFPGVIKTGNALISSATTALAKEFPLTSLTWVPSVCVYKNIDDQNYGLAKAGISKLSLPQSLAVNRVVTLMWVGTM
jgi:hypothetical protein